MTGHPNDAVTPQRGNPVRHPWLHRLLDRYHAVAPGVDKVLTVTAVSLFVIGVGATAVGVLGRSFPSIFSNVTWSIEVTTLAILAAVLFVVPRGLRENTHMAVTYLPARLTHRRLQVLTFVNQLLIIAFFAVVVRSGVDVMNLNRSQRTPVLGISLFWPYLVVVVTGALMLVESLVRLLEAVAGRAPRPADAEVVS